jgi:hypothetical protein
MNYLEQKRDLVRSTGRTLVSAGARLQRTRPDDSRVTAAGTWLDRAGRYLETRGPAGLRRDAEQVIVARPLTVLLGALLVGYVAARRVRS